MRPLSDGQVALEFSVLIGFLLVIVIGTVTALKLTTESMQEAREETVLRDATAFVVNEVQMAARVGPGYNRTFRLPLYLHGRPYNISIHDEYDLVVTSRGNQHVRFFSRPVQGNVSPGDNTIFFDKDNLTIDPS